MQGVIICESLPVHCDAKWPTKTVSTLRNEKNARKEVDILAEITSQTPNEPNRGSL